MFRRILILDVLLAAALISGGVRLRQSWLVFDQTHQIASIQPKADNFQSIAATGPISLTSATDWMDIPGHNLFSFDRTDVPIVAAAEPVKPPGPKPVLFGTLSIGAERLAMLGPGQSGSRAYRPMKVGEAIDGWTIVEVQDKAVIIAANSARETIVMNDPSAQIPRDYTRTTPAAAPAPQVIAPAPSTSATPNNSTPSSPPNGAAPRRRVIQTPFGPKTIDEP